MHALKSLKGNIHEKWLLEISKPENAHVKTSCLSIPKFLSLPRQEQVILCRCKLKTTKFSHDYILMKSEKPKCPTCHCHLDVTHILIECPDFRAIRTPLKTFLTLNKTSFTFENIFSDKTPTNILLAIINHINQKYPI